MYNKEIVKRINGHSWQYKIVALSNKAVDKDNSNRVYSHGLESNF
jgi:hypothetical protein